MASEIISRSITRNNQASFTHQQHPFALNTPSLTPSNNKDMAKKRTFAEIIDLTQHLSDEDETLKPSKELNAVKNSHLYSARSEMNQASMSDENMDFSKVKYVSSQRDLLHSETMIQHMNKRNDALRRDTYNAKTIPRDVLVAAGKHSVMTPLNYHLEILRKKFRHIDNEGGEVEMVRWK